MNLELDTESPYYKAATQAGFTLFPVVCTKIVEGVYYIECLFICCCGKTEYVAFSTCEDNPSFYIQGNKVDIARLLEASEAFSVAHLREDGYSKEDIDRIRKPFNDLQRREYHGNNSN